jgi:lipid II:glycine glycyltransferase (peptidoglycan interpeptide bridge formation enzyme)
VSFTYASSFDGLSATSRFRVRAFLDAADSASPFQDPLFFGSRGPGEVDVLVERNGHPICFALCYENAALTRFLPGLKTLVVHNGPVADDADALMSGLQALKDLARERRLCEISIDPQIEQTKAGHVEEICSALGFHAASSRPSTTLRLNLTRGMDEILAGFQQGTRYAVNLAYRVGITVRRAATQADFLNFYRVYQEYASKKLGWIPVPIDDFTALSERIRSAPERGAVFLSEHKGDVLGGILLLRAGRRVRYICVGINGDRAGSLPALHPVMYRAIEWAKEIGCTEFDFGGYGPSGVEFVRRFKEGFGGEVRTFAPAYSLELKPLVPRLRRLLRRFRS